MKARVIQHKDGTGKVEIPGFPPIPLLGVANCTDGPLPKAREAAERILKWKGGEGPMTVKRPQCEDCALMDDTRPGYFCKVFPGGIPEWWAYLYRWVIGCLLLCAFSVVCLILFVFIAGLYSCLTKHFMPFYTRLTKKNYSILNKAIRYIQGELHP